MYWAWRSSDWKNLPEPGGILDQDMTLIEDMLTYHQLYSAEEDRLDGKKRAPRSEPPVQVVLYSNLKEQKGKVQ